MNRIPTSALRPSRGLRVAAALLAVTTAGGLASAPSFARADNRVGDIFVTPNPGDQDTFMEFDTNAPCPDGTTAFKVTLNGPGITADGNNNLTGNSRYANLQANQSGGVTASAGRTLKQLFQRYGLPQQGTYTVTMICQNSSGTEVFGTLTADIAVTPGTGFDLTYTQASLATETSLAVSASPQSPVAGGSTSTITATVTPSNAAGTVQFKRGDTLLGAPTTVVDGQAKFTGRLTQGRSGLTAEFTPNDVNAFTSSTAAALDYAVINDPTISGTPAVGQQLGCDVLSTGSQTFAWEVDGVVDPKVTTAKATAPATWLGKSVVCKVTTTIGSRSLPQSSEPVRVAQGARLVARVKPTVSGTAKVGKTLTCKPGTWTPAATSYGYAWLRSGKAIAKATKSTYKPTTSDKAKAISCKVVANRAGHASGTATSASVKVK